MKKKLKNLKPVRSNKLVLYFRRIAAALKTLSDKNVQWPRMNKIRRTLLIIFFALVTVIVITIIFISPITRHLVEKYDVRYTGREITLDRAYVNPITGYIKFWNLKIYEHGSDSVFFSSKTVSINISLLKLLTKNYEISQIIFYSPRGKAIQNKKVFNFNDLIEKFSSGLDSVKTKTKVHFSILRIKIIDGTFYYIEKITPINYFIKNVNIESTGIQWDADTTAAKFSFLSGIGNGGMQGDFTINFKDLGYRLAVKVKKFDLNILEQYLNALSNYGNYSANLDADLKVKGNFKTAENVTFSGSLGINDFHIGKNLKDDYASFDKLSLAIYELSPKNHKYLFDSVSLDHPYLKYEQYDYSNNMQKMFGAGGTSAVGDKASTNKFNLLLVIGNYIKALSKNFFRSNYKINRLAIYNGNLEYNDYSMSEKFAVRLSPMFVIADSINKNNKRVHVSSKTGISPFSSAIVNLSINPNDSSDFDLQYHIQKMPAAMFNPYFITYTSFPFDRGTIEVEGTWHVTNGIIQSNNHLIVIDPRFTRRFKNKDTKWLPMRLIMAFVRERGNVIDYEIPITGDLKNPKFHLHDVVIDILGNIFVKPVTTPYIIHVKEVEAEIEKSLTLKWEMRRSSLRPNQEKFIEKMADFLFENPDATIVVHPQHYGTKEKEYILLFEAKKKYFMATNHKNAKSFSEEDAENVDKMSIRDKQFIQYLNIQTHDSMLFTVQDKCARLIGGNNITLKYDQLNKERENAFISFFKKREVERRVKFTSSQNVIPYNGFSFYKIEYKGEFPEALMKAYRKMNDLNSEAPRNLFSKERKKYKGTL